MYFKTRKREQIPKPTFMKADCLQCLLQNYNLITELCAKLPSKCKLLFLESQNPFPRKVKPPKFFDVDQSIMKIFSALFLI